MFFIRRLNPIHGIIYFTIVGRGKAFAVFVFILVEISANALPARTLRGTLSGALGAIILNKSNLISNASCIKAFAPSGAALL